MVKMIQVNQPINYTKKSDIMDTVQQLQCRGLENSDYVVTVEVTMQSECSVVIAGIVLLSMDEMTCDVNAVKISMVAPKYAHASLEKYF